MIVRHVDLLPTWAAEHLRDLLRTVRRHARAGDEVPDVPFSVTADRFEDIPTPLASLVDTVVHVPPLRDRVEDILPLARRAARRARGRDIDIAPSVLHAFENYPWPGNVAQLQEVVREAARQADTIELRHLPPEILSRSTRRLSRIEVFERDEIIRVLTQDGITMQCAAAELGMSRATIYRKLAHLDIQLPRSR